MLALAGTNFPATLAWGSLLPLASRGYRVFAVDLIGQPGRSTGPRLQTSGTDYVDWVDDVLDALDLPAAALVGTPSEATSRCASPPPGHSEPPVWRWSAPAGSSAYGSPQRSSPAPWRGLPARSRPPAERCCGS